MRLDLMTKLEAYQEFVQTRMNKDLDREESLSNYSMGLAGEAGEVIDIIKKHVYHKHELDSDKVELELGDVMFYVTALCNTLNIDLGLIIDRNVEKLTKRYPTGFSCDKSKNRKD